MSKNSRFFLSIKVLVGFFGTLNLGICTAFLLNKPITYVQLSVVYSLILGISLLLEYPTGNLADRFGRKLIYSLGLIAASLQYLGYAIFKEVFLLYAAAILGGIGDALISGALEAWLITEEDKQNNRQTLSKIFGMSRSLTAVVSIVGSLLIGLFLKSNLNLVYWTSGILIFLAAVTTIFIFPDNRGQGGKTLDFTFETIKIFIHSPVMIFLGLVLSAAFACYSVIILYWQPQAESYGLSMNRLPLLYALYLGGTAISSLFFSRYAHKIGSRVFILASFLLTAISFALMSCGGGISLLIGGLFCFGLGYGSVGPVFFAWAADIIPSDYRASMLSLMSAAASLISVLATMGTGFTIEAWGRRAAVQAGLVLNIFILCGLLLLRKQTAYWEEKRASIANEKDFFQ